MDDKEKAISVANLSKSYPPKIISLLWNALSGSKTNGEFVLKDISFDVRKGSCMGIVGLNGAGKSTLLQLLAGILTPTHGKVSVNGRLSAILELGSGFEDRFTGRENVELYSRVMGFSSAELSRNESNIKDFAELDDYYDRPLRTYSSGMVARLAFAVRAFLDFDVLLLDEVLAVGDAHFQRKCLRLIDDLREKGKTILFVSHNINQVLETCDDAALLNDGQLVFRGSPKECVFRYYQILNEKKLSSAKLAVGRKGLSGEYGLGCAELLECVSAQSEGQGKFVFQFGGMVEITFKILVKSELKKASFGLSVRNIGGVIVTGKNQNLGDKNEGEVISIEVTMDCQLNPGSYFLSCGLKSDDGGEVFQFRKLDFREIQIIDKNIENRALPYNGLVSLIKEVKKPG
ncbi:ABC transporter ATP-binding protein [Verrucomicrobia bacterium]|nr:ABC transporter ATP-binding protein [Verrucomicrobiota bacterium]